MTMIIFITSLFYGVAANVLFQSSINAIQLWKSNKLINYWLQKAFNKALRKYSKNSRIADYLARDFEKYKSSIKSTLFCNGFDLENEAQKDILHLFEVEINKNPFLRIWLSFEYKKHNTRQLNQTLEGLNKIIGQNEKTHFQLDTLSQVVSKIAKQVGLPNTICFVKSAAEINDSLSRHLSARHLIVNDLFQKINTPKCVFLRGTKSIGKTTTLQLLCSRFNNDSVMMIDCGYNTDSDLRITPLVSIDKTHEGAYVFIDGLSLNPNQYTSTNIEVLSHAYNQGVKVIVSTYDKIPRDFISINLDFIEEIELPPLTQDEVSEILNTYDGPQELSRIIHMFSSGHPAVVNAMRYYLQKNNWTLDDKAFKDIFSFKFTSNIQMYLAQIFEKLIPDVKTRELLNRLLIIQHKITDTELQIVSNITPVIDEPRRRFGELKPIWIDSKSDDTHTISSLLKNVWKPDLNNGTIVSINRELGLNIIKNQSISQQNLSEAILYLVNGDECNMAGVLYLKYLSFLSEQKECIANKHIANSFWIDLPLPKSMDLEIKIPIRIMQNMIFKDKHKLYLQNDLINLIDDYNDDSNKKSFYYRSAAIIFMTDGNVSSALKCYNKGLQSGNVLFEGMELPQEISLMNEKGLNMLLYQVKTYEELKSWFDIYLSVNNKNIFDTPEDIDFCLTFIERYIHGFEIDETLTRLNEILALISDIRDCDILSIIIKAKIIFVIGVLNKNISESQRLFDLYSKEYSNNNVARVLLNQNIGDVYNDSSNPDYLSKAESSFNNAVSIDNNETLAYNRIRILIELAAICGGRNSSESLAMIERAYTLVEHVDALEKITKVEVIGEHALALWYSGNRIEALEKIAQGYELVYATYYDDTNIFKTTLLMYGNCINYFSCQIANRKFNERFVIPYQGMFLKDRSGALSLYTEEKRYALSQVLFSTFDDLYLFDNAKIWMQKVLDNKNKLPDDYNFYGLFFQFIPYLASEKNIDRIIEIYYLIEKIADDQTKKGIVILTIDSVRESYLMNYIFPAVIAVLDEYILCKDSALALLEKISKSLNRHIGFVGNDERLIMFKNYLDRFINKEVFDRNTIIEVNKLTSNYYHSIALCYLLVSLSADIKYAFELQLGIIPEYDNKIYSLFGDSSYLFLTPFFEKYWLNRIESDSAKFENYNHLQTKGLSLIRQTSNRDRLKTIFRIVKNHIPNIKTNAQQDAWCD